MKKELIFKKILNDSSFETQSSIKYLINEFICDNIISFDELYQIISSMLSKKFTKEDLKKNIYPGSFNDFNLCKRF